MLPLRHNRVNHARATHHTKWGKAGMDRSHSTPRGTLLRRLMVCVSCVALLAGTNPEPLRAQAPPDSGQPPVAGQPESQGFSLEQLDALLAPIALYPDELLTQVLMASTYPLQVV